MTLGCFEYLSPLQHTRAQDCRRIARSALAKVRTAPPTSQSIRRSLNDSMPCCPANRFQRSSAITSIRLERERFSKEAICSSLFRCSSRTVRLSFGLLLFFFDLSLTCAINTYKQSIQYATREERQQQMKTLITVLLSAASLTILFGSSDPQTEPEVSVPSIVSTSSDNGGMRTRADTDLPSVRYGSQIDLNQPSVTLEQLDARSLTLEPNQIGINRSVEVSPNTRAQKFVNPDGSQIIVLIIKSSGASGIGVHFRNFALADGEEVYVYGAATDSIVFGPFTDKGPWGSGEFWSGTVDGDTVVIEFYKKTDENGQGFEIFEISHIFAELDWRLRSNEPDVLNCEVDASCYGDIEKNAVGRIMFNANGGTYVCTGTLLSNVAQDRTPYFLTANHCVDTQAVAQTVEVYWFYQTTSCNSGVLRPSVHTGPGANLLAAQSSNDFSLLRLLNNAPGGAVFSAWTSAAQSTGTSVFGLHHPDGYFPPYIHSYLRRSSGSITSTNDELPRLGKRLWN